MQETLDPAMDYVNIPEPTLVDEILDETFRLLEIEGSKLVGSLEAALKDEDFRDNLDGSEHHQPRWHQWGIITHTRKVLEMLEGEAEGYITQWGIKEKLDVYMGQKVDPQGTFTKWELFKMSIPPHDIGKFASKMSKKSVGLRDHTGHEQISGEAVADQDGAFWKYYSSKGLTDREIGYIATLAGKHFELGKIRSKAKHSAEGYSLAYANGSNFILDAQSVLANEKEILVELGLWFLVDNIAKTDLVIEAEDDLQIEDQRGKVIAQIEQKKQTGEVKDERLIEAVLQRPVNVGMAKRFLTNLLNSSIR